MQKNKKISGGRICVESTVGGVRFRVSGSAAPAGGGGQESLKQVLIKTSNSASIKPANPKTLKLAGGEGFRVCPQIPKH